MKNIKNSIFLLIIFLFFTYCSSFNEANKQNKSEEFLIEKKSPLVLPPDYDKLPIPNSETKKQKKNIKDLIISKDNDNQLKKDISTSDSLQDSIIEKIQKN
tara:strand:+ start:155 stop:457 length:303 start_codon:yes stop_codon:yes gene_type:complete